MNQGKQEIMVSIYCITYDQESYIRDAPDGFLKQETDFAYEALIHDNVSTDKTGEIIREYAKRYSEMIEPILQTENQYSKGLTNISGIFNFPRVVERCVAMCEGDDYWTDGKELQLQVGYIESHPSCALRFHNAEVEVLERAIAERAMRPYRRDRAVSPEGIIGKRSGYPTASPPSRTEMVRNLPKFYVSAPTADIPLQLLVAARGYGYYVDRPIYVYRLGGAVSWISTTKQGDYEEKQGRYFTQMEEMYWGFDRGSNGRSHEAVRQAIKRLYFLTQVNTRYYDIVLTKENREFYRGLNGRIRFFTRLETEMPWLYHWLQRLMHRGWNETGYVAGRRLS